MKYLLTPLIVLSLTFATTAQADQRGGFYLSGGLGLHGSTLERTHDYSDLVLYSDESRGLHSSIKIGAYLGRQFALYYVREASWFSIEGDNNRYVIGLAGLGGTAYFNRDYGSGYFEFALGAGDFTNATTAALETDRGGAAMLGLGYEFTKNLQLGVVTQAVVLPDFYYYDVTITQTTVAAKLELKL